MEAKLKRSRSKLKPGQSRRLALLFLPVTLLVGCNDSDVGNPTTPGPDITTVAQILSDPQAFVGREVTMAGRLTSQIDEDEFIFNDQTAEIWVEFTAPSIPQLNVRIFITGTIASSAFEVASWSLG